MNIVLCLCSSDRRMVDKDIAIVSEIEAKFKNDTNILKPTLIFEYNEVNFNYIYIPFFNRYYYVDNIEVMTGSRMSIECSVDVLKSFSNEILELDCIISKQEYTSLANKYDDDGSFITECKVVNNIKSFSNGLPDNGQYILIVAG